MAQQSAGTGARDRVPGQLPVPIRQFILKTHSRCNLACTYCYLYAGPDHSWRDRPRTPAADVTGQAARRIAEHAATHGLREEIGRAHV